MFLMAKHVMTGWSDKAKLHALKPEHVDYSNLADNLPDLESILNDPILKDEWREAQTQHDRLTRPTDGSAPRGGVNPGDQRAIYSLVRRLKPKSVLEVGTHLGYSTIHIAYALKRNQEDGGPTGALTSVDVLDVNSVEDAPWLRVGAPMQPSEAIAKLGYGENVMFVASDSVAFLTETEQTFDLVFLDGDHAAPKVYQEIQRLQRVISPNAVLLLHDYFPSGKALWNGSLPNTGPWRAIRRLQGGGAPIEPVALGALPWPTKLGSRLTSLALLKRVA